MLSYRHAFHAGNHADVLKHATLVQVLQYLNLKDKPYWYIDTHAGAGLYELARGHAAQNAEHESGIGRLWGRDGLPPLLADYLAVVRRFNSGGNLRRYPGSPLIAKELLRAQDRLRLFEMHKSDASLLRRAFHDDPGRAQIEVADGFPALKALLPPPSRRAVVLCDPSYEDRHDYVRAVDMLRDGAKRFATGTYLLWYPLLQRPEARRLPEQLGKLGVPSWLHATLTVQAPAKDGVGMHGSGVFVVNPPWNLPQSLQEALPAMAAMLGQEGHAGHTIDACIP